MTRKVTGEPEGRSAQTQSAAQPASHRGMDRQAKGTMQPASPMGVTPNSPSSNHAEPSAIVRRDGSARDAGACNEMGNCVGNSGAATSNVPQTPVNNSAYSNTPNNSVVGVGTPASAQRAGVSEARLAQVLAAEALIWMIDDVALGWLPRDDEDNDYVRQLRQKEEQQAAEMLVETLVEKGAEKAFDWVRDKAIEQVVDLNPAKKEIQIICGDATAALATMCLGPEAAPFGYTAGSFRVGKLSILRREN
jgi:hypothetical protein